VIDLSFLETIGPLGLVVVCLIVFAETGLLVGFFLPGDSMLFLVGLNLATIWQEIPIWVACLAISLSGFVGDQTGYWIGRRVGPAVFNRPKSKFFNAKNVERAHNFFERYGSKAVILAHFVPIMRTFIPVAAGVGQLSWRKFTTYNIIGVILWGTGVTLLGYFLGRIPFVREHVELVTLVFIGISFIPIFLEILKSLREKKRAKLR
jgi:membrane-associated protein